MGVDRASLLRTKIRPFARIAVLNDVFEINEIEWIVHVRQHQFPCFR